MSDYGFPESHAISFAHLAFASVCYKTHRAPEFFASLLNNQPMGFYSSATLIKDGQPHGLKFHPVCVAASEFDCIVLADDSVRLGLRVINTLSSTHARQIAAERHQSSFASLTDFKQRVHLNKDELRTLAKIGALNCFGHHRREALWEAESALYQDDLFAVVDSRMPASSPLPAMDYAERIQADFSGMNLTTGRHPMSLLRAHLPEVWPAARLSEAENGMIIRIAGNVICRQRLGTAKGFAFISLEDETGISNAIVAPPLFEANRLLITEESFLLIEGRLQKSEGVIHIKAERIERLNAVPLKAAALTIFTESFGQLFTSSSLPGCSPTNTTLALLAPSPKTVCVPVLHKGQARQPRAALRNLAIVGGCGIKDFASHALMNLSLMKYITVWIRNQICPTPEL